MTSVVPGSDAVFFCRESDMVEHLLKKILSNKKRLVGTEWELFFINPEGMPLTRVDGQRAFAEFKRVYSLTGYDADYIYENSKEGQRKIVGLNIAGLGTMVPEAGYQLEFSSSVSQNCEEIREKNDAAYMAFCEVARRLGYIPVFKGHVPGYAEKAEGMDRSRGVQWREYYNRRFGPNALFVREAQDGTACAQVTIDAGADKFHEFFRALLLIEPALTLYYANSDRSYVGVQTYGQFIPSQVKPIVNVWQAKNPREALAAIVNRLVKIEVPFLPDPDWPCVYKAEPLVHNNPPTVADLMRQGRLSEKMLNNIGGFFYTRPAFKNFTAALLEIRGVDSQPSPEIVTEIAQRVVALVYDDAAREDLLADYSFLSVSDISALHSASIMKRSADPLNLIVAGMRVADYVEDIIARSWNEEQEAPFVAVREKKQIFA